MNEWLDDFKTAVAFLTRLPMPHPDGAMPANFVRAHRMFPVVGALIGAVVGLLCLGLRSIGVPDLAAAALALGGSAILTGALHEDGLADVADGFGGGRDRAAETGDHARQPARHLRRDDPAGELCRKTVRAGGDSGRLCRAEPDRRARARRAASCRAMSMNLPYARKDGLARNAGQPDAATAAIAAGLALLIALLSLSWSNALFAARAGGLERARHRRGWRCGRSAARPATCSAAPNRWPRPRSSSCSPRGWRSHECGRRHISG